MISFGTSSPFRILSPVAMGSVPARGIQEGRTEDALAHKGDALLRQRVNAREPYLLFAPGGPGREIVAVGAGIVVGINQIYLAEARQG